MKVSVGCQGRFHFFDLARQMERLGHLCRLYTGYPRLKVKRLPPEKVTTFPVGDRSLHGDGSDWVSDLPRLRTFNQLQASFDWSTARTLGECDVYHCLSGAV